MHTIYDEVDREARADYLHGDHERELEFPLRRSLLSVTPAGHRIDVEDNKEEF